VNANRFRPSVEQMEQRDTPSGLTEEVGLAMSAPEPLSKKLYVGNLEKVAGLYVAWTHSDAPQQQTQLFTALKGLDMNQPHLLNVQGEEVTLMWQTGATNQYGGTWLLTGADGTNALVNHNETLVRDCD
jgi:hypothetical protein